MSRRGSYWRAVVTGHRLGVGAAMLRGIFRFLSIFYGSTVRIRSLLYRCGVFRSRRVGISVISVGNIVVGGVGKTPVVLMIARMLQDMGTVAVLSRGYGGNAERSGEPLVLSDGGDVKFGADVAGDEPVLLARRLPQAMVIVGRDRYRSALLAQERGAQFLILDDGMQHRRLWRDLEIVVVDGGDPLGTGHLLPRGLLREPLSGLGRADLIVAMGVDGKEKCDCVRCQVVPYSSAPVVGMKRRVGDMVSFAGERIDSITGKRVGIFCGIGQPATFATLVEGECRASIIDQLILDDHCSVSEAALCSFADSCLSRGAEYLLCTEKDMVKLPDDIDMALPVLSVKLVLNVVDGEDDLDYAMSFLSG